MSFLFTVLFSLLLIRSERLLARRPLFLIGSAVSVGGLVVMFAQRLAYGGEGSLGAVSFLVATAAVWGAYAVTIRRCMGAYPLRLAFGVISLYTAGALLVLMFVLGDYGKLAHLPAGNGWVPLIVSALLGITFGHVLFYRGIRRLGPVVTSGLLLASPLVTFVGAAIILNERMTVVELLGGLAIIAGGACLLKAQGQVETAG